MTNQQRRRIDQVLDPEYVASLDGDSPEQLRDKLRSAREEEDALSYVRRSLHGRLDLLKAELDLRKGGKQHGVEDLTSKLKSEGTGSGGRGGRPSLGLRASSVAGRRSAERAIGDADLAKLPDLSADEIETIVGRVQEAEHELSEQRRALHGVIDAVEGELARRYKDGLEPSLERLR